MRKNFLIVFLISFLVYLPSVFFGFSYLDDNNLILENQRFLSSVKNLPHAFAQDAFNLNPQADAYYRPVLISSFIFDYQTAKDQAWIYHLSNIFYHALTAGLVTILVKKLGYSKELSLLAGLLMALHPALAQAVAWIPGRNDVLLTLGSLLAMIFSLNYTKSGEFKHLGLASLGFGLGLFSKETGLMVLPFWLGFLWLGFKKRRETEKQNLSIVGISWSIIASVWYLMRVNALKNPLEYSLKTVLNSVVSHLPALLQFYGKMWLPVNLSVLPVIEDTSLVFGFGAITLTLVVVFWTRKKASFKVVLWSLAWVVVMLLPGMIRPNLDFKADFLEHRMYLSMVGLIIFWLETWGKKVEKKQNWLNAGMAGVLAIMVFLIWVGLPRFSNRVSFWENAVWASPHHPLAQRNLGAMYFLDGNLEAALTRFKKALELNPNEQMAKNNIGLVYLKKGEADKAIGWFEKELEVNPGYADAHFNLGLAYFRKGKLEEAKQYWINTLKLDPNHFQAQKNLYVLKLETQKKR